MPAPGGTGGTIPVSPVFSINRDVANDLRVSLNRHFSTMSAQGHTVNVQVGLGRTSWASLRQQIASNIGVVPIQITMAPASVGAGRSSLVNILGALASSQYNTTFTQGKQIVIESLHKRGIEARRRGGPVASGRPYLVGEEGPEVYWPSGSGYIQPARRGRVFSTGLVTRNTPTFPPPGLPRRDLREIEDLDRFLTERVRPDWLKYSDSRYYPEWQSTQHFPGIRERLSRLSSQARYPLAPRGYDPDPAGHILRSMYGLYRVPRSYGEGMARGVISSGLSFGPTSFMDRLDEVLNVRGGNDWGIFHATTQLPNVLRQGLLSGDELRSLATGFGDTGLGGRTNYVSTAFSLRRARQLAGIMRFASGVARGERDLEDVLRFYRPRYTEEEWVKRNPWGDLPGTTNLADRARLMLRNATAPRKQGLTDWDVPAHADSYWWTGEPSAHLGGGIPFIDEFLHGRFSRLRAPRENALGATWEIFKQIDAMASGGTDFMRSGAYFMGTEREAMARVDPRRVGVVQLAMRQPRTRDIAAWQKRHAADEWIEQGIKPSEFEMRIPSELLTIIGRRMAGGPVKSPYPFFTISGVRGLGGPEMANMARAYAMKPGALDALRAGVGGLGRSAIMESLDWYPAMGELIDLISSSRGIHPDLLAALTGKFSQNAPWPRNLLSALRFHDQFVGAPGGAAMLQFIDPNFPEKGMGQMKGVFASYAARKSAASLYQRKGNLWAPSGTNPLDILTGYKDIAFTRALRGNDLAAAIDRFVNYSMGFPQQVAPDAERAAGDMAIREFAKKKLWTPSGTQAAAWYAGGGGKLETQREWDELFTYLGWGPSSPGSKRTRAYHRDQGGPVWTKESGLSKDYEIRYWDWLRSKQIPFGYGRTKDVHGWTAGHRISPLQLKEGMPDFIGGIINRPRNLLVAASPFEWRKEAWGQPGPFVFPQMMDVHPYYRGRGLANALYSSIERTTGHQMMPGSPQTMFGKALWAQWNRPFGQSWGPLPLSVRTALDLEGGASRHLHTPDAQGAMCIKCGQPLFPVNKFAKAHMATWAKRLEARDFGEVERQMLTADYLHSASDYERVRKFAMEKKLLLEEIDWDEILQKRCAGGVAFARRGTIVNYDKAMPSGFRLAQPFRRFTGDVRDTAGLPRLARDFVGAPIGMLPPEFMFQQIGPEGHAAALWRFLMQPQNYDSFRYKAMLRAASGYLPYGEAGKPHPSMWWTDMALAQQVGRGVTLGSFIKPVRKMQAGGNAGSGLYVVGEVGPELFVPMTMAHRIPPDVMKQIPGGSDILPRRGGGPVRIGKQGPELFVPPENGVIVPHHLMNQVKFAQHGDTFWSDEEIPETGEEATRRRRREGARRGWERRRRDEEAAREASSFSVRGREAELSAGIKEKIQVARFSSEADVRSIAESISGRTPQGLVAQVFSSMLGGRGRAMARIAEVRAAQEEYYETMTKHSDVLGGLQAREEDLARARHDGDPRRIASSQRELNEYQAKYRKELDATTKVADRLGKAMGDLPGVMSVARNALSIFGGVAGYGLAMQAFGFAVSATMPMLKDWANTAMGFAPTFTKVTGALAKNTVELGGNYEAALGASVAQAGLTEATMEYLDPLLRASTLAKAGASSYAQASDLYRSGLRAMRLSTPEGLLTGYGGVMGSGVLATELGGGKGFIEQIIGDITQASIAQRRIDVAEAYPGAGLRGMQPGTGYATGRATPQVEEFVARQVNDLNAAYERATTRAGKEPTYRVQEPWNREDTAARLKAAGVDQKWVDLAAAGVALYDAQGNLVTTTEKLNKEWTTVAEGMTIPDIGVWTKTIQRAMTAEFKSIGIQGMLTRELAIPFQFALGRITQPYLAFGAGFLPGAAAGATKGGVGAAAMKVGATPETAAFISQMSRSYNSMVQSQQAYADQAIKSNADFIASMDGAQTMLVRTATGMKSVTTYSPNATAFTQAMTAAQGYSKQIAALQGVIADAQAQAAAVSYGNQIRILNRSLRDARGLLTGQGGPRNLGAMQRQQFDIQREGQRLELQLTARRIATQMALARFQAPGETGEERYARQKEAIIEAQIAQKKLTLSQKEFALVLPIFTENARRAAEDARAAIGVASTARQAELKTAAAQQNIAALTNEMNKELSTAQSILEDANKKQATALGAATDAAKNFGYSFKDVIKRLYQSLGFRVTTGSQGQLIFSGPSKPPIAPSAQNPPASVGGGGAAAPGAGAKKGGTGGTRGAAGLLHTAATPTQVTFGEAGPETAAILRGPRVRTLETIGLGGGGGGGQVNIQININNPSVRSDADITAIASAVERELSRKGQLLGLRSPAY